MAIVSRGGRVINTDQGPQQATQQALAGASQAAGQFGQLAEQRRGTQIQALQTEVESLLERYGPKAYEMRPDLMDQWAKLTGQTIRGDARMTSAQLMNYERDKIAPYLVEGARQWSKTPPTSPTEVSEQQDSQVPVSQTTTTAEEGAAPAPVTTPQEAVDVANARPDRLVYTPQQNEMSVVDPQQAAQAGRLMEGIAAMEAQLPGTNSRGSAARTPQARRRARLQVLDQYPELDPTGELRKTIEGLQVGQDAKGAIEAHLIPLKGSARFGGRTYSQQETSVPQGLFAPVEGRPSVMQELAENIPKGEGSVNDVTEALRANADRLFRNSVVRDEQGNPVGVKGVDPETGRTETFNFEQLGGALRANPENSKLMFGHLSGADINTLRQQLIGHGQGVEIDFENPIDENGKFKFQPSTEYTFGAAAADATLGDEPQETAPPQRPGPSAQLVTGQGQYTTPTGGQVSPGSVEAQQAAVGRMPGSPSLAEGLEEPGSMEERLRLTPDIPARTRAQAVHEQNVYNPFVGANAQDLPVGKIEHDIEKGQERMDGLFLRRRERLEKISKAPAGEATEKALEQEATRGTREDISRLEGMTERPMLSPNEAGAYADRLRALEQEYPMVFSEGYEQQLGQAGAETELRTRRLNNEAQKMKNQMTRVLFGEDGEPLPETAQLIRDEMWLNTAHIAVQIEASLAQAAALKATGVPSGTTAQDLRDERTQILGDLEKLKDDNGNIMPANEGLAIPLVADLARVQAMLGSEEVTTYQPATERLPFFRTFIGQYKEFGMFQNVPNPNGGEATQSNQYSPEVRAYVEGILGEMGATQ